MLVITSLDCGIFNLFKLHLRQPFNNLHRLHTHINNTQQQVQYVPQIPNFFRPIIRIVLDAAFFVGCYLVAFHNPLNSTLAVYYILIRFGRNVLDGDLAVINNSILLVLLREAHFLYCIKFAICSFYFYSFKCRNGFVVDV